MAHRGRWEFFGFLKVVIPLVYLFWALAIAGAAAATMTSEHEDDTWVSLTATDVTGREIVLAKLIGSLWRPRRLFSVIVLLLAAGIGVESLHYLSLPSIILAMAVYGWFAAALGVWISIQLRSTWRAQFLTIALLLLINLTGQGILNMASPRGFAPNDWPGFTPYEIAKLAMEPPFLERFDSSRWPRFWRLWEVDESAEWLATFSIISLLGYASFASVLTWHALLRFEVIAGRARRGRGVLLPSADGPRLDAVASAQPT
jgi:hypothetical protein